MLRTLLQTSERPDTLVLCIFFHVITIFIGSVALDVLLFKLLARQQPSVRPPSQLEQMADTLPGVVCVGIHIGFPYSLHSSSRHRPGVLACSSPFSSPLWTDAMRSLYDVHARPDPIATVGLIVGKALAFLDATILAYWSAFPD